MAQSLAPFVIVFDAAGEPRVSSGQLHGKVPHPPAGVFEYVRQHQQERVTWQPERGVRMASVIVRYQGSQQGFVLAARSLREIENREDQVGYEAGIAWILILGTTLGTVALGRLMLGNEPGGTSSAIALG